MAVQSNNSKGGGNSSRRGRSIGRFASSVLSTRLLLKRVVGLVMAIIAILIILAGLFGIYNQRQAAQGVYEFAHSTGTELGETMMDVYNDDSDAPIRITDQGIYVNGYEPENAEGLIESLGNSGGGGEQSSGEGTENQEQSTTEEQPQQEQQEQKQEEQSPEQPQQ